MMVKNARFALVTDSSRGIGRAIALELAEHRHHVTQLDQVRRMIEHDEGEFGALDVLVSNARLELAEFYQAPRQLTVKA